MSLTPAEAARLSIEFPQEHADQIRAKAMKHGLSVEDAKQEVSLLRLELGPKYDPSKGSMCAYVLGHLDKRLRRQLGAHKFAVSLDSGELDEGVRARIENMTSPEQDELASQPLLDGPGLAKIRSIASFVSGKSSSDLSRPLGVNRPGFGGGSNS